MKIITKIGKILYFFVIVILIVFAITTISSAYELPGGYRLYVVQSGSMEPAIKIGSVVLVAKQKQYEINDIITYSTTKNPEDNILTITHRVYSKTTNEGIASYTTKGDSNQGEDRDRITEKQILGKVLLSIPYIGYAVAFAKTQVGLIVLIVIPGTIIVYSELINIKNEIVKVMTKKKEST